MLPDVDSIRVRVSSFPGLVVVASSVSAAGLRGLGDGAPRLMLSSWSFMTESKAAWLPDREARCSSCGGCCVCSGASVVGCKAAVSRSLIRFCSDATYALEMGLKQPR